MTEQQPQPSTNATLSPQLRCTIQTIPDESSDDDNNNNDGAAATTPPTTLMWQFQQEEGKKSSFVLDFSENGDQPFIAWDKPAHLIIECVLDDNDNNHLAPIPFLLGGLELVSNSRNMEVYLTKANGSQEDYLMTCRGIPASQSSQQQQHPWHKTLSVIPGGPRSVVKVHLKLLGLRPDTTTHAVLQLIKVKGRLPLIEDIENPITTTKMATPSAIQPTTAIPQQAITVSSQSAAATTPGQAQSHANMPPPSPIHTNPQPQTAPPPPTSPFSAQPDLGMAFLAGISNMLRATEDRMLQTIQQHVTRQVQHNGSQLSHQLSHQQKELLDKQHKLMRQQQRVLENQGRILQQLESRQAQLIDDVSKLQGQLQQVVDQQQQPVQQQSKQQQQQQRSRDDPPQQNVKTIIPNGHHHEEKEQVEEDDEANVTLPSAMKRAVEELLADEPVLPPTPQVYDDVDEGRSDTVAVVPDDEDDDDGVVLNDLLEIRECDHHDDTPDIAITTVPTTDSPENNTKPIMNNDSEKLWLPEPDVSEQDRDVATTPTKSSHDDNTDDAPIVDLLQWLTTSTPTGADRLQQQQRQGTTESNEDRPVWIVGEGTDDMVVIHGLPPPTNHNSSESPPTIHDNDDDDDRVPAIWSVLLNENEEREQEQATPGSPSQVKVTTTTLAPTTIPKTDEWWSPSYRLGKERRQKKLMTQTLRNTWNAPVPAIDTSQTW